MAEDGYSDNDPSVLRSRAPRLHLRAAILNSRALTSQVYFEGGDYLDRDVAHAVREGLVAKLVRGTIRKISLAPGLARPYFEVHQDFMLVPCNDVDV